MNNIKYLHWEDYYKNNWLNDYEKIKNIISSSPDTKNLLKDFTIFYNSTTFLLQTYLRNYGSYYKGNSMIIIISYRINLIDNGDTWVVMNDMILNPKKYKKTDIIKFCIEDNFRTFDYIKENFLKLLEAND